MMYEFHNHYDNRSSWLNVKIHIQQYVHSDADYMVICLNQKTHDLLINLRLIGIQELDLIQLLNLPLAKKGALGLWEIRWVILGFLQRTDFIKNIYRILKYFNLFRNNPFFNRYANILNRRESFTNQLLVENSDYTIIPNYVEPKLATFILSKQFSYAILEFNFQDFLSFERACFALARGSNFNCIRLRCRSK